MALNSNAKYFRSDYKINDAAANGIVYDNGTSSYSMQVFQCTCASSNVSGLSTLNVLLGKVMLSEDVLRSNILRLTSIFDRHFRSTLKIKLYVDRIVIVHLGPHSCPSTNLSYVDLIN